MKRVGNLVLFLFVAAVLLVAIEAGYRVYLENRLHRLAAAATEDSPSPVFSFFAYPAPWRFDAAQGFVFNDGPWLSGKIRDGAFTGCDTNQRGNRFGNAGKDVGGYENAEIKILILGSSYTMSPDQNGDFVNLVLARRLSDRLGKRVSILNFSRDATGLLTSFDIAKAKLEALRPDILLFVFNITALAYQRHWRVLEPLEPGFWRLVFSLDPDPTLRDRDRVVVQPHIVGDQVTAAWCEKMGRALAGGDARTLQNDPLVRALVAANRRTRRDMTTPQFAVDHWTLSRSFIYDVLAYGDPYRMVPVFKEKTPYGSHGYWSFVEDARFVDALTSVQESGVPYLLVHVPTLAEMRAGPTGPFVFGHAGVPAERGAAVAESLAALSGHEIVHLYAFYDAALKEDPLALAYSEENSHPNPRGVTAMAQALEALLLSRPDTRAALGLSRNTAAAR